MDELKKGIDDLAVTKAPTTIDPPDLPFEEIKKSSLSREIVTAEESETDEEAMIDEILKSSEFNEQDNVTTVVHSPTASNPSSELDW